MAPYDRWVNDPSTVIANDIHGIQHSVQEEGSDEFEVRILPARRRRDERIPSPRLLSRWFKEKKKPKNEKQIKRVNLGVHFDETVVIYDIARREDLTQEEKSRMWINAFDWNQTQTEKQRITRAVLLGEMSIDNPDHRPFLRGLETIIPGLAFKRRDNILTARSLVLKEQTKARLNDGELDVHRLGGLYGTLTEASRKAAHDRGIEDYCEVLKDNNGGKKISVLV